MTSLRAWLPLLVILLLYAAQGLPLKFIAVAFPVLMRQEGVSLERIGLLGLLQLPWTLKVLWAPYVDRWGAGRRAHYKSWIFPLQAASVAVVLAMAGVDFGSQFGLVVVLAALFTLFAATQDIAVDALCVRLLAPAARPIGNAVAMTGVLVGSLVGGGAMVVLYGRIGWSASLAVVAAVLLLPLVFLAALREPPADPAAAARPRPSLASLWHLLRRPGLVAWLLLASACFFGSGLVAPMARTLLVDLRVPQTEIAFVLGVIDPAAGIAGLLAAPPLVKRLGRKRAFLAGGLLNVVANGLYVVVALRWVGVDGIRLVYGFESFAAGLLSVPLFAILMDNSTAGTEGTDFTAQNSLLMLSRTAPVLASGYIAKALGYPAQFALGAALCLAGLAALAVYARRRHVAGFTPATPVHAVASPPTAA